MRTDKYGETIPPRAMLLTSNDSVIFTGGSERGGVVIEQQWQQHLEDLSAIDVRAIVQMSLRLNYPAFSNASHAPRQIRRSFFCKVGELVALAQTTPVTHTHYLSRPERPKLNFYSDASTSSRIAGLGPSRPSVSWHYSLSRSEYHLFSHF
jgi:hypothetical protein